MGAWPYVAPEPHPGITTGHVWVPHGPRSLGYEAMSDIFWNSLAGYPRPIRVPGVHFAPQNYQTPLRGGFAFRLWRVKKTPQGPVSASVIVANSHTIRAPNWTR